MKPIQPIDYRNRVPREGDYEGEFPPSMTVQGEALTVEEILVKYTQGEILNFAPPLFIEAELDDPDGFMKPTRDLIEIENHIKRVRSKQKQLEFEVKKATEPKEDQK